MKATHQSFSISFVCGAPGSGKSYMMTRDVIERLQGFSGKIYTNLPLNVEKVAEFVAEKTKQEPADVVSRIVLLDRDTLVKWQDGRGGPWELAETGQADGNDFILDECHLFCKKGARGARTDSWTKWLGEVRHEGWRRIVFVTQDESKVGTPITAHAELRFELTNAERMRDPFLHIPLAYWYELIASFTREYSASIALTEYRRIKGKLREQHVERMRLDPFWFPFYRSYEAAGGGAGRGEGGSRIVREYEKRPTFLPKRIAGKLTAPVWGWVLRSHWWRFAAATLLVGSGVWVCFAGGGTFLIGRYLDFSKAMARSNGLDADAPPAAKSPNAEGETRGGPAGPLRRADPPRRPTRPQLSRALLAIDDENIRTVLAAELTGLRLEASRAQREVVRLKHGDGRLAVGVKCVAINQDSVWLGEGVAYKRGETIHEGPLTGRRIVGIDFAGRKALLDDGSILRVGGGPGVLEPTPADGAPGPKLRESVPGVRPEPGDAGPGDEPDAGLDVGGGDAPGGVPAPGLRPGRNVGDRGAGSRKPDGDARSAGPARGRSLVTRRATAGSQPAE